MEEYLWQNKILFKDYQDHVKRVSGRLKKAALAPLEKQKIPVIFLHDPSEDKSRVAHKVAEEKRMTSGLLCVISTMEPSPTFEHRGTHIIRRTRPCHVLYPYQIHPELGWMHAPDSDLVSLQHPGRPERAEWLARHMAQEGLQYVQQGNCFLWIEDYKRAQETDEPAGGEELGGTAERFCEAIESGAREHLTPVSRQLLLDLQSIRMGNRHRCSARPIF